MPKEGEAVVKGDGKYACIAAASIVAKVTRDRLMVEYASQFPQYGFDRHFGYPTPEHFEAIRQHGPCAIHRRSFAPIRDYEQLCLTF
jgi:ribonuclease HII